MITAIPTVGIEQTMFLIRGEIKVAERAIFDEYVQEFIPPDPYVFHVEGSHVGKETFYKAREAGGGTYKLSRQTELGTAEEVVAAPPDSLLLPTDSPLYDLSRLGDFCFGPIDLGFGLQLEDGKKMMDWLVHNDWEMRRILKNFAADPEELFKFLERGWRRI